MAPPRKCGALAAIVTGALSGIIPGALLGAGAGAGLGGFVAGMTGESFLYHVGMGALMFAGFGTVFGLIIGAVLWSHVQRCSGRMLRLQDAAWLLSEGGDVAALKRTLYGILIGALYGIAFTLIGVASILSGAVGKKYGGNLGGVLCLGLGGCAAGALLGAALAALAGRRRRHPSSQTAARGSGGKRAPDLLTGVRRGALLGAMLGGVAAEGMLACPVVVSEPAQVVEAGITLTVALAWGMVLVGFVLGAIWNVLLALQYLSRAPTLVEQPDSPQGRDG